MAKTNFANWISEVSRLLSTKPSVLLSELGDEPFDSYDVDMTPAEYAAMVRYENGEPSEWTNDAE